MKSPRLTDKQIQQCVDTGGRWWNFGYPLHPDDIREILRAKVRQNRATVRDRQWLAEIEAEVSE